MSFGAKGTGGEARCNLTRISEGVSTTFMYDGVNPINSVNLPPPVSFANVALPPPEQFANYACTSPSANHVNTTTNWVLKPPVPAKPLFLVNRNMNNNASPESSWNGTMTGTTKLRNLMLLREPTKKPSVRQAFADDDSSDSFSDTDDSLSDDEAEEEEIESEEASAEPDASSACAISVSSGSSFEVVGEENSDQYVVAKVTIPDHKIAKCMQLKITESVWSAKQRIIQSLAKKLRDPLNYGLYAPKEGKFLLDHRPISDYIEGGSVGDLQMRYKYRTADSDVLNAKQGKQYAKMQSVAKRRDFIQAVQQCATEKIYSAIRKGIDPNFQCSATGETPLTMLCKGKNCPESVPVFMALLGGKAHLDFRNKAGLAPMHVAVCNDNTQMIRTLLEFQASPSVPDGKDLTPLYHCVLFGSSTETVRTLLQHGSLVGCYDSQEWSELHQACRYGRLHLLELLLNSDKVERDMINARNASGNTPLHVCALYNEEACALALLMHGADTAIKNFSNQDAVQVAHVASSANIAQQIIDFPDNRDRAEFALLKARDEYVPGKTHAAPSPLDAGSKPTGKKQNRSTWTPGLLKKHSKNFILTQKQQGTVGRNSLLESYFSPPIPLENRFDSKLPPNAKMPDVKYPKSVDNGCAGENKVRIVVQNYDAKNPDELTLRVGTRVIVLNARSAPAGYDDGMVDGQRGFFPKSCVEEVQLRRPLNDTGQPAPASDANQVKSKNSIKKNRSSADAAFMQRSTVPDSASVVSFESYEDNHSSSTGRPSSLRSEDMAHYQATASAGIYHNAKSVAIRKGSDGYGFILRGAKAEGHVHEFRPTPKYPGLQYMESVQEGSNAYIAGLRSGDFITTVGTTDVRQYGHQQLVDTIRACGEPLHIQVVTVIRSYPGDETSSLSSGSSSSISKHVKGHNKTDSITSALDQLDNVIAAGEVDHSERTASVRRVPGRKVGNDQLQSMFRSNAESAAHQRPQSTHSTFSNKKPLRVLPPTVSATNAFQYADSMTDSDSRSVRSASSSSSSNSSSYTTWGRNSNPPAVPKEFRAHSVSGATGERLLVQSGAKSKKVPPPPPRRIDSRLSMTIPEEPAGRTSYVPSPATNIAANPPTATPQSNMAAAVALAARSRAERLSQSKAETTAPRSIPENAEVSTEDTKSKPIGEMSPALSIALAAKQRRLRQQSGSSTANPPETKKQFIIVIPTKAPAPPSNLPPPPPRSDYDDVTGLALPPPPAFPPPGTPGQFDAMDLPPPPLELLPSPVRTGTHSAGSETKSSHIGVLPPPPVPPPGDEDDCCLSPGGADNLSNADSGVADVAGDGLNSGHRHNHDYAPGDNHSTVSSLSATSTLSSEDSGADYSSPAERAWPLKEVKAAVPEDRASSVNSAGNMYLDVLKKAKSKQPGPAAANPGPAKNFTVTKMTFGPKAAAPVKSDDAKPKTTTVFPPAPKEYSTGPETKPLFGKAPAPKSGPAPKASPSVKVVETTPVVVKEQDQPAAKQSDPVPAKKPVAEWTVSDVTRWLDDLGLSAYAESFEENAIAGEHLPDLGKDELIELGVKPFGHRLTLERSIKKLIGSS